jgi:nucleoside-diphosphate-sugar epimerase
MSVLVMCGSGFIGQHLIERLRHDGCAVRFLAYETR